MSGHTDKKRSKLKATVAIILIFAVAAAVIFHVALPGPAKHRLRQHRNHAAERTRMRPVSRNPCDLSQQTPPYRCQEPVGVTGVLQEAGNLFMPVIHLLQNYSELTIFPLLLFPKSVFCRKHLCNIFVFCEKHLTLAHKSFRTRYSLSVQPTSFLKKRRKC